MSPRAKRYRPTRADLDTPGPAIRLSDLSALVGWSRQKLLTDAAHHYLTLVWVPCSSRQMATVERAEAARYYDSIQRAKAS
jgi:hypothetical protein